MHMLHPLQPDLTLITTEQINRNPGVSPLIVIETLQTVHRALFRVMQHRFGHDDPTLMKRTATLMKESLHTFMSLNIPKTYRDLYEREHELGSRENLLTHLSELYRERLGFSKDTYPVFPYFRPFEN